MTKPNFDVMSKAELRAYVIAHQDDQEAFYALDISENDCRDVALLRLYKGFRQRIINFWRCQFVDLVTANPSAVKYPASMTPEEIHEAVLEHIQEKRKTAQS